MKYRAGPGSEPRPESRRIKRKTITQELDDLVAAYRILAAHGVIDAYGHVSLRSPRNPERYYLARSVAPELVNEEDLIQYDLDSNPIDAGGREAGAGRFLPRENHPP